MKKLFFSFLFVCSFAVLSVSCNQDDELPIPNKGSSTLELSKVTTSESFNYSTTPAGSFGKVCNNVSLNGKSYIRLDITNTGATTLYLNVQSTGSYPGTGLSVSLGAGSGICYDLPISGWTGKLKLEGYDSHPSYYATGTIIASAY